MELRVKKDYLNYYIVSKFYLRDEIYRRYVDILKKLGVAYDDEEIKNMAMEIVEGYINDIKYKITMYDGYGYEYYMFLRPKSDGAIVYDVDFIVTEAIVYGYSKLMSYILSVLKI